MKRGMKFIRRVLLVNYQNFHIKRLAQIIDDGMKKGYYPKFIRQISNTHTDKKIRNIRPSEELVVQFINWSIVSNRSIYTDFLIEN